MSLEIQLTQKQLLYVLLCYQFGMYHVSICIPYPAFLPGSDPTEFFSAWEEQVMRNMAGRVVF